MGVPNPESLKGEGEKNHSTKDRLKPKERGGGGRRRWPCFCSLGGLEKLPEDRLVRKLDWRARGKERGERRILAEKSRAEGSLNVSFLGEKKGLHGVLMGGEKRGGGGSTD